MKEGKAGGRAEHLESESMSCPAKSGWPHIWSWRRDPSPGRAGICPAEKQPVPFGLDRLLRDVLVITFHQM